MILITLAITKWAPALASGSREAEDAARRTAQLFAAALTIRGARMLPSEHRYYEATVEILRAMLTQDELEALEEAGRAMSVDEAIAFTLAN